MEPSDLFSSLTSISSSKSAKSRRSAKASDGDASSYRSCGNLASVPASVRGSQYFSSGMYISNVCPPETSWVPENFSEYLEAAFTDGDLGIQDWEDDLELGEDGDNYDVAGDDASQKGEDGVCDSEAKVQHSLSVEVDKDRPLFTSWHEISAENRFIVIPRKEEDVKSEIGDQIHKSSEKLAVSKKDMVVYDTEYDSVQSSSSANGLLANAARKIADGSEYDSVQSSSSTRGLLASAARKFVIRRKSSKFTVEPNREARHHMKKSLKNLIVLCIGYTMSFSAFFTLRNLQSSLSSDGELVMLSLSIIYFTYVGASVFSNMIVEKIGFKNAIIVGQLMIAVYTGCNFYPVSYVIIPASFLLGFSLPNMWIAHGLYLTALANSHATWSGKSKANAISRFNGVFFMFWHSFGIVGNLASALIFYPDDGEAVPSNSTFPNSTDSEFILMAAMEPMKSMDLTSNYSSQYESHFPNLSAHHLVIPGKGDRQLSFCGAKFCNHHVIQDPNSSSPVDITAVRIFLGVFIAVCLLGVVIIVIFLDKTLAKRSDGTFNLKQQLFGIFKHLVDRRALLLVTLVFYLGLEQGFVFSEITKAFVSCPYGIYKIGFLMISFGLFDAISSILAGQLQKHLGRAKLSSAAFVLNISVLITLLLWEPTADQEWVIYVVVALWGLSDGIWVTMTNSMVGIIFIDTIKSAYASTRQIHALGYAVAFGYSQYLCMSVKIYVTMAVLVVGFTAYIVLECLLNKNAFMSSIKGKETEV